MSANQKNVSFRYYQLFPAKTSTLTPPELSTRLTEFGNKKKSPELSMCHIDGGALSIYKEIVCQSDFFVGVLANGSNVDLPGQMDLTNGSVSDLTLPNDNGLARAMPFILDPKINVMGLMRGVSITKVLKYVQHNGAIGNLDSELLIDPEGLAPLDGEGVIKKFAISVKNIDGFLQVPELSNGSVGNALKNVKAFNAGSSQIVIKPTKKESLKETVITTAKAILQNDKDKTVTKLLVEIDSDSEGKQIIDLLADKVETWLSFEHTKRQHFGFQVDLLLPKMCTMYTDNKFSTLLRQRLALS